MSILIDSYSESNQGGDFAIVAITSGAAQAFKPTVNITLTSAKFYLKKQDNPTGNITFRLYEHTGTFGTTGKPTGNALSTSNTLDVSTLSTFYTLQELTFPVPYNLVGNTPYCIAVLPEANYTGDVYKNVHIGDDTTSPSHEGNYAQYYKSSWIAYTGLDLCFYVYGVNLSTVTTGIVTNIGTTTVTLNGEITNTGGENNTIRGFEYKTITGYELSIHEDGSFGTGTFSLNVSSLFPSMPYSFRAYSTNSAGTGYGDWVTFETLSPDEEIKRMSRLVYDDLMAYWNEEEE